jgi:hypothetical protein
VNGPNVRSATVRLNAEVAKYIADMKAAGRATEEAFSKADLAVQRHNDGLEDATGSTRDLSKETTGLGTSMEKTTRSTKQYNLETAIADERAKRLRQSLQQEARSALDAEKAVTGLNDSTDNYTRTTNRSSSAIDKYSGRMGILVKTAAALGPSLIPIGAVGIAGVSGLASQFGFAAVAAGTAVIAFQGVGTALTAVNKAALQPTAANIEKAHQAMLQLSPAGRDLVKVLTQMKPLLMGLRDSAQGAMFPGLIKGLESLERLAPSVDAILTRVGGTLGDLFAEGADSLASPRWAAFFAMIAQDARPVLTDMAHAIGDVAHGLAQMWEAFEPLNLSFGSWLADSARSFDQWASGLSQTQGFEDFIAYVRENGPRVAEAFGAIANAVIQVTEAAAPLGGPVLHAITEIANVIAAIADSPLGTPIMAGVTALSALSLASAAATAAVGRLDAGLAAMGITGAAAGAQAAGGIAATGAAATGAAAATSRGAAGGVLARAGFVGGAGGALPILAVIDGVLNTTDAIKGVTDGTYNWAQATARTLIPAIHGLEIFGVKMPDWLGGAEDATDHVATATEKYAADLEAAAYQHRNVGGAMFATQKQMLKEERQADRLRKSIGEHNKVIRDAASAWGDYSQKVDLAGPSLDTVIARMHKLAEAAANEAENIKTLLTKGVDPKAIQNLYNRLGPQGAVLALQQLAHAGKDVRHEFEHAFDGLADGKSKVRSALRDVDEAITGSRAKLHDFDKEKANPKVDLDTAPFDHKRKHAESDLEYFQRINAIPTADLNTGPLASGIAAARHMLATLNGAHADTFIIVHTIRTGNDTAGGPAPLGPTGADGMTVPGPRYPYGDKVYAKLAPGEEVITNRHGEADRFRADRAAGRIPAYADGTTRVLTRGANTKSDQEVQRETEHRKRLNAELKEATKATEAERKERDRIVDRMHQLEDSIKSSLTTQLGADSSADPWSSGAAGGTLAGNLAIVQGDTREARRLNRFIEILKDKGFEGAALEDLLSRSDINEVADYAHGSRQQLHHLELAFAERNHAMAVASRDGADAALGARLDEANEHLRRLERGVRRLDTTAKVGNRDRKVEHRNDRQALRSSAGNAARNRRRDPM